MTRDADQGPSTMPFHYPVNPVHRWRLSRSGRSGSWFPIYGGIHAETDFFAIVAKVLIVGRRILD